ncbi:pyridoxal phosphate-dependent aminotransferase [Lutibacter sp.]|uniref:pyridoxal phosphate-dependent aminotransferase n=1 Tax=Lutibacter sp. TaxID=1925666 RepID=UPI0025C6C6F7|nr:pyridoxal phosphate-dependent aminotransferase [Lutibacter sp.]MCF6167942.1 pyridoxal phosphate-dependent aminotransferase [Lutibacter sp.]
MTLIKNKLTPINYDIVKAKISTSGIENIGKSSIRELVSLVNTIEEDSGEKFIRMEMGVPGLAPPEIGTNAEITALKNGVASKYPMIDGIAHLKDEISLFVKNFLNIDVDRKGCIPTVGSMQGGFASFLMIHKLNKKKDTVLFIDPGFPVQKQQLDILEQKYETFDVYNYRGEALKEKLESYLIKGNISSIIYSNPNNPSWICFSEKELKIIAELAIKYNIIVIEDLAYFAMDFRKDYSKPGKPPYQPTVANYTDNWILLISSSKTFSYAGQRVGMMVISDQLFNKKYPQLEDKLGNPLFGYNLIYKVLYSLSSGVTHSAQYGLAAMLNAVNNGTFNFVEQVKEYGRRAKVMKKIFTENGFTIVYDKDEDKPLADGFYFTFSYKNMSGDELLERLLYYGISAISLAITGSEHTEGLRACVSQTKPSQFKDLEFRLKQFHKHYPN